MARRRTCTILTEAERDEFVRAAVAFHKACTGPMASMRTDAADYPVLRDMALAVSDALGKLTGDPTPWHTPRTS
jgi:hypothetical protein